MKNIKLTYLTFIIISCKYPTPETYLIPKGYHGRINIIFNLKEGEKSAYDDNGRRIYNIPSSGILLTQFKNEDGIINHKYYYIDSAGIKTPLKIFDYKYDKTGHAYWIVEDSSSVGIFEDGTVGTYGNSQLAFQEFVVCNIRYLDSINKASAIDNFLNKLDSVLKSAKLTDSSKIK